MVVAFVVLVSELFIAMLAGLCDIKVVSCVWSHCELLGVLAILGSEEQKPAQRAHACRECAKAAAHVDEKLILEFFGNGNVVANRVIATRREVAGLAANLGRAHHALARHIERLHVSVDHDAL